MNDSEEAPLACDGWFITMHDSFGTHAATLQVRGDKLVWRKVAEDMDDDEQEALVELLTLMGVGEAGGLGDPSEAANADAERSGVGSA